MMDLNPIRLLPRFQNAYRSLPLLRDREQWTRGEIECYQLERLNSLWTHARTRVPHYRQLAARLPEQFGSLEEYSALMPILERETVREAGPRLCAEGRISGLWASTSGSTGLPLRVFWSHDSVAQMMQTKYRFLQSWDIDIFDRKVFLWGGRPTTGILGFVARMKQRLEDALRRRIRLNAFEMEPEQLRRHLQRLIAFQPTALYGYSTGSMLLANEAANLGMSFPWMKLAILTSEPITPAARRAVERGFGVPVAAEYGSIECGFLAGEAPDRTLRVREDRVIVETVPDVTGTYALIVTMLDNPAFPLLRYRIGDLTSTPLRTEKRGFAILTDVAGRANDMLASLCGRRVHPFQVMDIFEPMPGVRRWRVQQSCSGAVCVLIEPDGRAEIDVPAAEQQTRLLLGGQPVTIRVVNSLPAMSSGKHRWIVSNLPDSPASPCEVITAS